MSSSSSTRLKSSAEWHRVGRGRSLQFFATDSELSACLATGLPADLGPFELIATSKVKSEAGWSQAVRVAALTVITDESAKRGDWEFLLWSRALFPNLDLPNVNVADLVAANGFVVLQHGRLRHGLCEPSSIGVVDRVASDAGVVEEHVEQRRLFSSLKKAITEKLVYGSVIRFPDGRAEVDTKYVRMTEGAAGLAAAGVLSRGAGPRLTGRAALPR